MKNTFKIGMICALALTSSQLSQAADWEFWSGSFANVDFASSGVPNSNSTTQIGFMHPMGGSVNPGIGYNVGNGLQVKVNPGIRTYSDGVNGDQTAMTIRLLGGVNYSFLGTSAEDAFFVEALAGINSVKSNIPNTNSSSKFTWSVGAGKRFPLMAGVAWAPAVNFRSTAQDAPNSASTVFSIVPIQFTLSM